MAAISPTAARPPMTVRPFGLDRFGDERLARLIAAGDDRAFATLYERYHQPLYRYCRSIVHDETDAQDALQSAFAGALVALRRAQRSAPMRPWLFRIAHNEAISLLRRRCDGEELSEASGVAVASAEDQAEDREQFGQLVADLRELPGRVRGALLMRELSGLSHEEIAIVLDTSLGAAKQAIFDARRALLEFEEGRAMACEAIRRSISDGDGRVMRGRRVRAHLRHCPTCAAFATAIPARRAELRAFAPGLPVAASAATLARVIGSGTAHGVGVGGGAGTVAVGATGKTAGAIIAAKALAGGAILVTAAAGVTVVLTEHHPGRPARPGSTIRSGPTAASVRPGSAAALPAAASAVPATGTRALGTVPRPTTHVLGSGLGRPSRRAAASTSARAVAGVSTTSATRITGLGAHGAPPNQTRGKPAQTRGRPAQSRGGSKSRGVGRHAGGRPATLPNAGRTKTAGRSPASAPGRAQPRGARSTHSSGAR